MCLKKVLICVVLGRCDRRRATQGLNAIVIAIGLAFILPLSAWGSQLKCEALLTSSGLVNSPSPFEDEISKIIGPSLASKIDDVRVKVSWGVMDTVDHLWIKKGDIVTHQSLPRIPTPSAWDNPNFFHFTVVVQGASIQVGPVTYLYRISRYPNRGGKAQFVLSVNADAGSQLSLLNLYVALSMAPFVDQVIFDQEILPTEMSYEHEPTALAAPERLRAIRAFRQFGADMNKREEAVKDIKPGIVKTLESGKQLDYIGTILTGFSDDASIVEYPKATAYTVEYVFRVPSERRR